jgi:hypothetical protein
MDIKTNINFKITISGDTTIISNKELTNKEILYAIEDACGIDLELVDKVEYTIDEHRWAHHNF